MKATAPWTYTALVKCGLIQPPASPGPRASPASVSPRLNGLRLGRGLDRCSLLPTNNQQSRIVLLRTSVAKPGAI